MDRLGIFGPLGLVALLGACATPPVIRSSTTTVILLPDEDGNVGSVSVTTVSGARSIDKAYSFTTVDGPRSQLSSVQLMGDERVAAVFGQVLGAQPPKPKSFVLYFLMDKTLLTEESKSMLPALFEAVRARKPTEISIFGHADATGSESHNYVLSGDRARKIAELIQQQDRGLGHIEVQFFGDKEPLFPAVPHAPEPRNRRVEVVIL
jgi:peptidoglycan-associated lipoprotein